MCWPSTSDAVNETDNDHDDDDREGAEYGIRAVAGAEAGTGKEAETGELFAACCVELCLVPKFLWPLIARPKLLLDLW